MATKEEKALSKISFVTQKAPVDERGRALYAVARSIIRALVDQIPESGLTVLNTDRADVTLRQLAYVARLQRDKGMRGDGFEWAVHEAIQGAEPTVIEPLVSAMKRASPRGFKGLEHPESLLFGYERAKYLGFLEAVIDNASEEAVILPDTRGRPPAFDNWVRLAATGEAAEPQLGARLKKIWRTDLFVSDQERHRHLAVTIKSNKEQLESGPGLRIGVVPEHKDLPAGVTKQTSKAGDSLWVVTLPDPHGFMGLYNDAYGAVGEAVTTLGRHGRGNYWQKPTPMAQKIQQQLEDYADVKVAEIEWALNEAAQQDLADVESRLLSVDAPDWLHLGQPDREAISLAPRPSFVKLD